MSSARAKNASTRLSQIRASRSEKARMRAMVAAVVNARFGEFQRLEGTGRTVSSLEQADLPTAPGKVPGAGERGVSRPMK